MWWIAAVALSAPPAFESSPTSAVREAAADARRLKAQGDAGRLFTRYLSLYHLGDEELAEKWPEVLNFALNSLSRAGQMYHVRQVHPRLYALKLSDYGFDPNVWERLDRDPYFYDQANPVVFKDVLQFFKADGKDAAGWYLVENVNKVARKPFAPWAECPSDAAELSQLVSSRSPVVRADFWLHNAMRVLDVNGRKDTGVNYYDWLGVKSRGDFFRLGDFDEKRSVEFEFELVAALKRSKVIQATRQVDRLQAFTGPLWRTRDSFSRVAAENAIEKLKTKEFAHKAEEHYLRSRNGLWWVLLCDDKGTLVDYAPPELGDDDTPLCLGRDKRIHNGIACFRCHTRGLQPVNDFVRRAAKNPDNLKAFMKKAGVKDEETGRRFMLQFLSDLEGSLKADIEAYRQAVYRCNRLSMEENATALCRCYNLYEFGSPTKVADLSADQVARELGRPLPAVREAIRAGRSDAERLKAVLARHRQATADLPSHLLGLLEDPPENVRREHLEEFFSLTQDLMRGYVR